MWLQSAQGCPGNLFSTLPWPFTWQLCLSPVGFFGHLAIVLQLSGDLLIVALGAHHFIFWLQFFVYFPNLVHFGALSRPLLHFVCSRNYFYSPVYSSLVYCSEFHLREMSGTASLLPVSCLYQHFISPLQCRAVTVHLSCPRKAEPSRGIHRKDEVCDRKISCPVWKAQTLSPQYLDPSYSKYSSENKLTGTPFYFLSKDLQHQKISQLQLGNQLAFLALLVWQSLAAKSQPERRPNEYINKKKYIHGAVIFGLVCVCWWGSD